VATTGNYALWPGLNVLLPDLGISPAAVLRRAGLPGDLLSRGRTMVTAEQKFALWRAMEEESGDPEALPIRIGLVISAEVFDPPIFAALCSLDLNGAAERLARFKPLIGPMVLDVVTTPTETRLTMRWPREEEPPPGLAATELVFWVALARMATRARIVPRSATLPNPPGGLAAYREFFGRALLRGPDSTIVFSAEDAVRPFVTANAQMWEFFEPELRRRLSELTERTTTAERVRAVLIEQIPAGRAGVDTVARELAMSPRTLQRRLRDEGTTFQATLDETREALARHYLARSGISVGEISLLLGYEDQSSFYRAFQSWTGETPANARAAAVA